MRSFVECTRCLKMLEHQRRYPLRVDLSTTPDHLIAAMIVSLHAMHEGHELRMVIDGEQIFPMEEQNG